MTIEQEKEKIRALMRSKLKLETPKERLNKSFVIATKLQKISDFKKAKTIMFYYSTDEEVNTLPLMNRVLLEGKKVVLPYVDKTEHKIIPSVVRDLDQDLIKGSYGIMEPKPERHQRIPLSEIDLVLVPALAFDHSKYRLGRGKGFYDRFLSKLPRDTMTFGLAFDFQIVETLPVTELDIPVIKVIHN